jgi:hypothetical protein
MVLLAISCWWPAAERYAELSKGHIIKQLQTASEDAEHPMGNLQVHRHLQSNRNKNDYAHYAHQHRHGASVSQDTQSGQKPLYSP